MKRILLTFLVVTLCSLGASAQRGIGSKNNKARPNTVSVGVGGGARCDYMHITNVSPDLLDNEFPDWHFVASVFASWEFWDDRLGIRPQFAFLKRGAYHDHLTDIGSFDIGYEVKVSYIDVRLPLVFNILSGRNRIPATPYVYVSPVLGFASGGKILLYDERMSSVNENVYLEMPVTDANMAKHYFGVGAGAGVKFKVNMGRNEFFCGLEAMYDYGLTDTYSKKEKSGKANDVGKLVDYTHYKLKGKRTFSGVEMQFTLGVPFTVDCHRKGKPKSTRSVRNL